MGREIEKSEVKVTDATKPWRRQFFQVKKIGPVPPMSPGLWNKPEHGLKIKGGK